jgi:hypothetical protein
VPIAYTLFAASVVLAIGTVTRRTGLAVAGGFGAYVVVRLLLRNFRQQLIPPLHQLTRVPAGPAGIHHAWIVDQSYTVPGSHADAYNLLRSCITSNGGLNTRCLAHYNIFSSWVYEPASRFWPLQGIEAGIFVAMSAALLALAVWWIRHRIA